MPKLKNFIEKLSSIKNEKTNPTKNENEKKSSSSSNIAEEANYNGGNDGYDDNDDEDSEISDHSTSTEFELIDDDIDDDEVRFFFLQRWNMLYLFIISFVF